MSKKKAVDAEAVLNPVMDVYSSHFGSFLFYWWNSFCLDGVMAHFLGLGILTSLTV